MKASGPDGEIWQDVRISQVMEASVLGSGRTRACALQGMKHS